MAALRRSRWRAALIVLGLGVACLGCFTDPINRAPVVMSISADSSPVMRGQPASFTATAYDPDSDSFTISWTTTRMGTCPNPADRSMWPTTATIFEQRLTVDMGDTGTPFCVWAFATDRYGAVGANNLPVNPGNLPPVAMIELLSPSVTNLYPLYTTFELSNASTDPEGDRFNSTWMLTPPPGSTAQLVANGCSKAAAGTDVHCFEADAPGMYTVQLTATATTPDAASNTATMVLHVNVDTLPCIDIDTCVPSLDGTPSLDPTEDQTFKVSKVIDDGDPSPSSARYSWFVTVSGALLPIEHDYATLTILAPMYHEGDVTKVRVQAYDRNRQAVDDALRACGEAADKCAGDPQRPTCYQRVTWTVNWL